MGELRTPQRRILPGMRATSPWISRIGLKSSVLGRLFPDSSIARQNKACS